LCVVIHNNRKSRVEIYDTYYFKSLDYKKSVKYDTTKILRRSFYVKENEKK